MENSKNKNKRTLQKPGYKSISHQRPCPSYWSCHPRVELRHHCKRTNQKIRNIKEAIEVLKTQPILNCDTGIEIRQMYRQLLSCDRKRSHDIICDHMTVCVHNRTAGHMTHKATIRAEEGVMRLWNVLKLDKFVSEESNIFLLKIILHFLQICLASKSVLVYNNIIMHCSQDIKYFSTFISFGVC